MGGPYLPDLKKLLDRKFVLLMNGGRKVSGNLMGFDQFLNIVLEDAIEIPKNGPPIKIGTTMIRGNCISRMEIMERL